MPHVRNYANSKWKRIEEKLIYLFHSSNKSIVFQFDSISAQLIFVLGSSVHPFVRLSVLASLDASFVFESCSATDRIEATSKCNQKNCFTSIAVAAIFEFRVPFVLASCQSRRIAMRITFTCYKLAAAENNMQHAHIHIYIYMFVCVGKGGMSTTGGQVQHNFRFQALLSCC